MECGVTVIDLAAKRAEKTPHLEGKARCIACQHEWEAVAPVGTVWLDCPECSLNKGAFIAEVLHEEDHWTCDCGNILFCHTPEGAYCPNCGLSHDFES